MKVFKFYWLGVLTLLVSLVACNKENNDEEEIVSSYLVDYEAYATQFSSKTISSALNVLGATDLAGNAEYNVNIYTIVYKTLFEGDTIYASGVVATPDSEDKSFPMLSYQHGTLFKKSEAPSLNLTISLDSSDEEEGYIAYLASTGVVIVMADYIGFGESDDVFHPYMHKQYTVNAVLDMIRASEELIQIEKPCNINDQLFLYGYSQGGSATVAALSAIENNNANSDLTVTAASAGSGAYDLNEFRSWIMDQSSYEKPAFIVYILESYSKYAGVDVDYSSIFSSEFADKVSGLIDGETSGDDINASFGTFYIDEIFNDNFEDDSIFENSETYETLRQAFDDNSIDAWNLNTPLRLYCGLADTWIPSAQSSILMGGFTSEGTNASDNAKLVQLSGMDHTSAFIPALTASLEWFSSF